MNEISRKSSLLLWLEIKLGACLTTSILVVKFYRLSIVSRYMWISCEIYNYAQVVLQKFGVDICVLWMLPTTQPPGKFPIVKSVSNLK